ncbi:peptidoglycan-binding domain-containing protein [Pedobacter cryotolerans]|uniref:Peptidoglycan-binding protein n=1 Tax=Pedobacter cryotolerans TaxID=2571270 RepID=A0A4U1CB17_9SPHI|nr:peptidoglycan-binding domain-containing protein [Pedobacter cryotolerans]TKC03108.1 peptidoglycan-binding protein [Pedobacter cryotolerans]
MTGQEILNLAKTKVGQKYVHGIVVPKNKQNYNGAWDCAEFTSYIIYQVSNKLYGCYNNGGNPAVADAYTGYWARDSNEYGKIITVDEAARIAGAIILRAPLKRKTGHIVVSDGKGGTVEAHSTKKGLIAAKLSFRRWDYGVLVPWINYEKGAKQIVADVNGIVYRYTEPPMVNLTVGKIQKALQLAGYDPQGNDNIYGPNTALAVEAFQQDHGIVADGEVGEITAKLLKITL